MTKSIHTLILILTYLHSAGQNSNFDVISKLPPSMQVKAQKLSQPIEQGDNYNKLRGTSIFVDNVYKLRNERMESHKSTLKYSFAFDLFHDGVSFFTAGAVPSNAVNNVKQQVLEFFEEERSDKYITGLKNAWQKYYSDITIQNPDITTKSEHLESFISSVKNYLDPNEYPIVGQSIDEFVLSAVKENRNDFMELANEVDNFSEETRKNLTSIDQSIVDVKAEFEEFEESFNDHLVSFSEFRNEISKKVGDAVSALQDFASDIENNRLKIEENRNQIETNRQKIDKNEETINLIGKLSVENNRLIEANSFKIDVMSEVLYGNASVDDKIKLIRTGVVKVDDPESTISKLSTMSTLQEINQGLNAGAEVVKLASNLGLDDKTARRASKMIQVTGVLTSVASAYLTGGLTGFTSGLAAVNSLFGSGESGPDPYLEQIFAQLQVIDAKLDEALKRLENLDRKLEKLIEFELRAHEEIMNKFKQISGEIVIIQSDIQYIISILNNKCKLDEFSISPGFLENVENAETIDDLKKIQNSYLFLSPTLDCINAYTLTKSPNELGFLHAITNDNSIQNRVYKPLYTLLKNQFLLNPHRFDQTLKSMYFPIKYLSDFNKHAYEFTNSGNNMFDENKFTNLIDGRILHSVGRFALAMEPYFIMGDVNGYKLMSMEEYSAKVFPLIRNAEVKKCYKQLLNTCEIAISQNMLISGIPLLNYFYKSIFQAQYGQVDIDRIKMVLDSRSSTTLKLNLASHILNTSFRGEVDRYKQIDTLRQNINVDTFERFELILNNLNGIIGSKSCFLERIGDDLNGYALGLAVQLAGNKYVLPIPPTAGILEGVALYPDEIYLLAGLKKKLEEKITEYELIENLNLETDKSGSIYFTNYLLQLKDN